MLFLNDLVHLVKNVCLIKMFVKYKNVCSIKKCIHTTFLLFM
jgi:hypothetical protein